MAMTLRADKGAILSWNEMDANFRACMGVHNLFIAEEHKPVGVGPGSAVSGAWRTRPLSNVIVNTISGVSMTSSVITLPAGEYFVQSASPIFYSSVHVSRIQKTSGTPATLAVGSMDYTTPTSQTSSILSGKFTLTEQSTVELQYRVNYSNASDAALGQYADLGQPYSVFSNIRIWKLS